MLRKFIKLILQYTYRPWVLARIAKDRYYTFEHITLHIKKGVFHPGFFFSTRFLLHELTKESLAGKNFLELGAGSGLLSFYASTKGALVTASDISAAVIEGLKENRQQLAKRFPIINQMNIIQSDLFNGIPAAAFDYILINPPYYPSNPANDAEKAWYCGENFEYFQQLFSTLAPYMQPQTQVWLSVSEDCNINRLMVMANDNMLSMKLKTSKYIWGERNFIYTVSQK